MADLNATSNLVSVLALLTANDSVIIKNAEKALKPFLKQPSCVIPLLAVLRECDNPAIRHHAALLLRKKVGGFFPKYGVQQQAQLKTELVTRLLAEPDNNVATAIAGSIAVVAKAIFKMNQDWPEIFQLLLTLAQDPNEKARTLNYKLLTEVF